jgi:hypothetical protein
LKVHVQHKVTLKNRDNTIQIARQGAGHDDSCLLKAQQQTLSLMVTSGLKKESVKHNRYESFQ